MQNIKCVLNCAVYRLIVGIIHHLQSVAEYMYVTVKFAQT